MNNGSEKVAILFNGPPRAGKDTAVNSLMDVLSDYEIVKFTGPLKDLTHLNYGLDCSQDAYEVTKDTPLQEFNGKTPRQAYIETSAALKASQGEDAVAQLFVNSILASAAKVILNPDVGDDMEALAVAKALGHENVLVIRIHKDGHDFSNDCRTWVQSSALTIIDVENLAGRRREFESEIAAHVQGFLENVLIKQPAYMR